MSTDTLFSPFQLKNYKLKNRIGVAPMTRMSSPGDSIPRRDVLDFLVRRVKNGAAIVYTEAICTDYDLREDLRSCQCGRCAQGRRHCSKRQIDTPQP